MWTPGVETARDHPRGLIVGRSQRRVRRGDDDLELRELVRLHVDRSVGADVGFDALAADGTVPRYFLFSASISWCCSASSAIDTPPAIFSPYE